MMENRDKNVKRLIRRGEATHEELHDAQFGDWPLRGMNYDIKQDGRVRILPLSQKPNLNPLSHIFSMGSADFDHDTGESLIYLNKKLIHPAGRMFGVLATRQAYARLHDVAYLSGILAPHVLAEMAIAISLSSYRYAVASSLTKVFNLSVADIVGEEQIHSIQLGNTYDIPLSDVFHNNAKDWLENQPMDVKAVNNALQVLDTILTLMPRAYFAQDTEMQARLHNVMTRGYGAWKKLPENETELYAALLDMGIKAPTGVGNHMRNDPAFSAEMEVFNRHNSFNQGHFSPPNAEINVGLNSYRDGGLLRTGEVLAMYWRDTLPFLYADLLTKYGDSTALDRFGYSGELDLYGVPIKKDELELDFQ